MNMENKIGGVIAALLTPRRSDGSLDEAALRNNIEFVLAGGIAGICVNGATGEYVAATLEERRRIVEITQQTMNGRGTLVCGIGSARLADTVRAGRDATEAGAGVLLLPPPHFFPYAQDDLAQFYHEAVSRVDAPVLIYNLPGFTSPVETPLALRLIETEPRIIGIKDSGPSLDTLEALTAKGPGEARRIVGNDALLPAALRAGYCDGAISGIAGVLPELTVSIYNRYQEGNLQTADRWVALQDELIAQLVKLPTPWGLKFIAQCRGQAAPGYLLPLSPARRNQEREFETWFAEWWRRCEALAA